MADSPPRLYLPLHLPGGETVWYTASRPNVRVITRQIRALGYDVWVLDLVIPGSHQRQLPRLQWLHAIVLPNRVILLLDVPDEVHSSSASSVFDSDNVDSDTGSRGVYRSPRRHR